MDKIWIYTFLSIAIVSAASLIGIVALVLNNSFFKRIQSLLVSFAVGTLLGGAVLHLLPESMEHDHDRVAPIFVLISILAFFLLEKYLNAHRHYNGGTIKVKSFGILNLFADSLHNFLDGILIAAAFSVDVHTGIVATLAVLAHELPQEIGDFAVLVQAGYKVKKALLYNLISALSSFIGAFFILVFPTAGGELSHYILPLAAGGFLYIALADLIPELNTQSTVKRSLLQVVFMLAGILLMWLLLDFHTLHH